MHTTRSNISPALERHKALVEALSACRDYPHPAADIEVLETHASTVLLVGEYAYKIKKPVKLAFLDFSTLSQRRHYCEEELRLNRRLAPQWYLGVVAITGTPERPRIGGEGEVLEYAVRMRRFAQRRLADRLLSAGELALSDTEALARQLAAFHAAAPVAADRAAECFDNKHLQIVVDNLSELDELLANDAERGALLAQADRFIRGSIEALRPLFAQRRRQGALRECHGDLHLGNIAFPEPHGPPLIFDALEFDPALRWLDVIDEIGFLTMDLQRYRASAHARWLLNNYLEALGDYRGLAVLRFYQCHRALVRAKVLLLQQRQGQRQPDGAAAAYLQCAAACSQLPRPALAITYGPSASGKSTLAGRLVRQYGYLRLRSDVARKQLHGLHAEQRSGSSLNADLYAADATARTYRQLLEQAEQVLAAGYPVVLDATYLQYDYRRQALDLARRVGCPFLILELPVSPSLLQQRIERRLTRPDEVSEADLTVLQHQLSHTDALTADERRFCVELGGPGDSLPALPGRG